jgi:hypothetical protein
VRKVFEAVKRMFRREPASIVLPCVATASPGDVLVLKSEQRFSAEQFEAIKRAGESLFEKAGVKVLVLSPEIDVARLEKFQEKASDGKRDSDHPLPFLAKEVDDGSHYLG